MKKLILIFSLLFTLLNSCNKYEDGPIISLRSPMNRLLGKWEVYYFEMNGNDLTTLYKDSCNCNFSFISKKSTPIYFRYYNCKPNYGFGGYFKLLDNDNKISTNTDLTFMESRPVDTIHYFNIFGEVTNVTWFIKRLKYKDLWIYYSDGVTNYYIKLKKIGKNEE